MPKSSGTIGMRCLVGLLQTSALIIGCVIVHKIDEKTQENCRMIAVHSERLDQHDAHFEHILNHKFSREFAIKLREYLPHDRQ
jgi:hypothetical protein